MDNLLVESKDVFKAMLDSVMASIRLVDKDLNVIWANSLAKENFGRDIIGQKCCCDDRCPVKMVFQDGLVHEHDVQLIGPDGRMKYFHSTASVAIKDDNGNIKAVIEVAKSRDLLESKYKDALKYRIDMERIIVDISTTFISTYSLPLDGCINLSLQMLGKFCDVDRAYVFLFHDKERILMSNTHEWCVEGIEPQLENLQDLNAIDFKWWIDSLLESQQVHIPRVLALSETETGLLKDTLVEQDIQSVVSVPLVSGKDMIGFLGFDSVRKEKVWSEEDIALLGMVAEVFANAIEKRKMEKELDIKNWAIQKSINPIVFSDLKGQLIDVNTEFVKIWGYKDKEDIIGVHTSKFWQYNGGGLSIIDALNEKGKWDGKVTALNKDEEKFKIKVYSSMIFDDAGLPSCLMSTFILE